MLIVCALILVTASSASDSTSIVSVCESTVSILDQQIYNWGKVDRPDQSSQLNVQNGQTVLDIS